CEDVTSVPEIEPGDLSVSWGPNPFRDVVRLDLAGWTGRDVRVAVFDPTGRRVRTVFAGKVSAASAVQWDGRDASGRAVAAGIYWLRVSDGADVRSARIVRVR
ncbi:MAG: hypothetical protein KC729_14925, partial [Candidatus Eisenbacteria bacterium]|nr:hypothetical protein [Candidatus Eisenbacteria bacterium]